MIKKTIEKFTPDQEIGIEKIQAFAAKSVSRNWIDNVFVLTGKAGTGKTTVIMYALWDLIEYDIKMVKQGYFSDPNVYGFTNAHKAKKVLGTSIPVVNTFAACYGLKVDYNDDGSERFFKPKPSKFAPLPPCQGNTQIFVMDEASMCDIHMLRYIMTDTNRNAKVIFMGDPGQLPPITQDPLAHMDADSPVFELQVHKNHKHHLTTRMRQSEENPILELSDIIYEEIFGNQDYARVFKYMKENNKIVNDIGFNTIRYRDFMNDFQGISTTYMDSKVVAYRKNRVEDFNRQIRNRLYNNPADVFISGELITMNDTYMYSAEQSSKSIDDWTMYNSDEYKIDRVANAKIKGIDCHLLYVDKTDQPHLQHVDNPYVPVVAASGKAAYEHRLYQLTYEANTAGMNDKHDKWQRKSNFIKSFGKVAYGYAYTGHKVQGSGYKNIYVDVNDIFTVSMISTKRKLQALYTGTTRATDVVKFLAGN